MGRPFFYLLYILSSPPTTKRKGRLKSKSKKAKECKIQNPNNRTLVCVKQKKKGAQNPNSNIR
jgi:hypothetical protein